ncbi:Scr1 family TA system antitoxin-like transcriptional regulator [Streptomyces boncukensis]|uniref:Helix-turn-helix domain-containing protein n=1 Tax=Streptomyces boncukensis TaxID=2711219 RepID=A0A6G4WWR3_9ACTN|nr:helix-turn-helix domain-containing protein [Streptomyces boncukensis]
MPARSTPTVRQRRLGAELRKMREHAGLTVAQAAERLGVGGTLISNSEAGRVGVSADRVRVFADTYDCTDQAYVAALADMAVERAHGWWDEYRGSLATGAIDLAEVEHHAVALRCVLMMHVPGLLQTEEYAKAVFATARPSPDPALVRRLLSHRMKRRDVLDRPVPPQCTFLMHEAALRMQFGGRAVLKGQLRQLLESSERENVTIRVVPFSVGGIPNAGTSTDYFHGPVPQLDTVHLDVPNPVLIDAEALLAKYHSAIDTAERAALSADRTRDFIKKVDHEL